MGGSRPFRLCPTVLCPDWWWWGGEGDREGRTGACDLVGVGGMPLQEQIPCQWRGPSPPPPPPTGPDLLSQLEGRDAALPEYL